MLDCSGDCDESLPRATWLKKVTGIDAAAIRQLGDAGVHDNLTASSGGPVERSTAAAPRKVAFLFLLEGGLSQPDVWAAYFQHADPQLYGIYAHVGRGAAPRPGAVQGLAGATLIPTVPNEWCALFGAEVALLRAALQDGEVAQFVFVADDAVPLASFDRTYAAVMREPQRSSFCLQAAPRSDGARHCRFFTNWEGTDLPKHEQFVTLGRAHARAVAERALQALSAYADWALDDEVYSRDACSDEVAPLAALLLGLPDQAPSSALEELGVQRECRTFAHWRGCAPDDLDADGGGGEADVAEGVRHPATFRSISISYLRKLQRAGFLFLRKLSGDSVCSLCADAAAGDVRPLSQVLPALWLSLDSPGDR